jgi:stage II sporulation protein E
MLFIFSLLEVKSNTAMTKTVSLAALEAIIALVSAGLFKYGIDYMMQAAKGVKMNNEQMISIAVMVAVIIYAIPDLKSEYIAPIETVVFFIILYFTYKYGAGQGTITGAVCGFALSLRGAPITDVGMFTMMGIIPAIFREMGRFPSASVYMITAALLGIANKDMELSLQEISALASAVLLFLLLPGSLIYRVDAAGGTGKQEILASQNLKKIANTRMKIFSESFLKLSKTLDTITEKQVTQKQMEINSIFEDISDKLCKNCSNCSQCWESNLKQTYQSASRARRCRAGRVRRGGGRCPRGR